MNDGPRAPHEDEAGELPLTRLFALAYKHLLDGLYLRLRERGWADVRGNFGFVLLATRDGPRSSTELAGLLGTTKQAASQLVDGMVAAGYVRRLSHPVDARVKLVEPTARGHDVLAAVEAIYRELEAEWAAVIGRPQVEAMRRDIEAVLRQAYGDLPPVRPPS